GGGPVHRARRAPSRGGSGSGRRAAHLGRPPVPVRAGPCLAPAGRHRAACPPAGRRTGGAAGGDRAVRGMRGGTVAGGGQGGGGSMGARVAVAGASGYAGGELLRLLAGHPDLEIVAATAHTQVGAPIAAVHPHLALDLTLRATEPAALADADLVFLALPHG